MEGDAALRLELSFQVAEHRVGPRPDITADAAVRHEPLAFELVEIRSTLREVVLDGRAARGRYGREVRGGPRAFTLRMGDEDSSAAEVQIVHPRETELLAPEPRRREKRAGDSTGVNENITAWYANANDIAGFLNAANPRNWPFDVMQAMMKTHLDLTLQEAVAQLTGDYATSIATYDQVHLEILQMADMLSAGIVAQFPAMFNGSLPM